MSSCIQHVQLGIVVAHLFFVLYSWSYSSIHRILSLIVSNQKKSLMRPKLGKFRPLNSKSDRIAHVSNNWKHRSSTSGWTLTIAFGFTAIDDDTANARGLQAFPRPLLIRHFLRASHSVHVSFSYFGGAAFLLFCEAAAQSAAAACRAGITRWRGSALDNRPSWRKPGEYAPLARCKRRI